MVVREKLLDCFHGNQRLSVESSSAQPIDFRTETRAGGNAVRNSNNSCWVPSEVSAK